MLAADHAARLKKPMVVVKVGRTDEGESMAMAHTGHLTGSDAVTSAVFRQFGITRADGLDDLLDTAAAFARTKPVAGDGVGIYAISGGTGAHMADMVSAAGLRIPPLAKKTQRALHDGLIPEYLRVSNPVDCGGPPVADARGRRILDLIVADPNVDLLVVPITGAVLNAVPGCKGIVRNGVGFDNVDLEAATRRGVWVANVPDSCTEEVATHADLGAFQLLLSLQDEDALISYCRSVLGPIEQGEGDYGEELVRSLDAFIEHNGHWEKAANALYCHRHTLRYRIRRIEQLTGRDFSNARDRIEFWLALRGRELAR